MPLSRLATLGWLLMAAWPLLAAHVPLVMTATADRAVLLARPLAGDAIEYRAVPRRFDIETAKLTLTFFNTGDEPLKLNAYALQYGTNLRYDIIGPDGGDVIPNRIITTDRGLKTMPVEADYPVLLPGNNWSVTLPIAFPNLAFNNPTNELHPGVYRVRILYAFMPDQAALKSQPPLADGAFLGEIASNGLTFKLVEASQPVNGLQIALDTQPTSDPLYGDMKLTGYLRNVSDKPITVNAWDLFHDGLQLIGDDGKLIPFTGGNLRSREATLAERYTTLAPGEKQAYALRGGYRPSLDTLTRQVGNFGIEDPTGFYRNWPLQGSAARAYAVLEMPEAGEQPADAPTPLWAGKVTSPTIVVPLNPTAYRQARLKKSIADFALSIEYRGPQEKGMAYYTLRLGMQPEEIDGILPFREEAQLAEAEAATLIDYLAQSGALRDAASLKPAANTMVAPSSYYSFIITGDRQAGTEDLAIWTLALGWDLATYQQLQALRAQLPKDGQTKIDVLLAHLSVMHDRWIAEDALRQPLLTLDTPAGTINEAARAIVDDLHCPALRLTIDPAIAATPVMAYHFFNVTADIALQALASATLANYTVDGVTVSLHAMGK